MQKIQLSVVIPVFNEEENLKELYSRLKPVIEKLTKDYELIFVNDGSTDRSIEILQEFSLKDKNFKIIDLSRNFGHQIAITAGLKFSSGNSVVVMDADLQDPPEMITNFWQKLEEGYDIVYGIRERRKENIFKKTCYKIFYRFLRLIANIEIPVDSGDFCIMKKKIVDLINSMPERNRYMRGLRSWVGFRQIGIKYNRMERYAGSVKYTFNRLIKLALDAVFSFSYTPLHFVSVFGFVFALFGFIGVVFVLYLRLFTNSTVPGTTTIIILILLLGGLQLIALGVSGEYIARVYDEVKNRPSFVLKRTIGFEDKPIS